MKNWIGRYSAARGPKYSDLEFGLWKNSTTSIIGQYFCYRMFLNDKMVTKILLF